MKKIVKINFIKRWKFTIGLTNLNIEFRVKAWDFGDTVSKF